MVLIRAEDLPAPFRRALPRAVPYLTHDNLAALTGNWQAWVVLGTTHVLKAPKTLPESADAIRRQRVEAGRPDLDPESFAQSLAEAYQHGCGLVRSSAAPPKLFGDPIFLGEGCYVQTRVRPARVILRSEADCSLWPALIAGCVNAMTRLWRWGLHETSLNFTGNFGLAADGTLVLMDFGELTSDREEVAEALESELWRHSWSATRDLTPEQRDLYFRRAESAFTPNNLDRLWLSASRSA
jgi:hypothetical protein